MLPPAESSFLVCPAPERLLVDHVVLERAEYEGVREVDQGLGMSQEQVTAAPELVVEALDHLFLRLAVEIDDHVPAENDVHVADQACLMGIEQVYVAERNELLDAVDDAVIALLVEGEVLCQHAGVRRAVRALLVDPLPGRMQHPLVDVAPDDLDLPVAPPVPRFEQEYGDGVGLLAGRAPGAPDAERLAAGETLAQIGQDLLGKRMELRVLAEKIGFVRGQVVDEGGELLFPLPVVPQEVIILLEAFEPVQFEAPGKPVF